MPKQKAKVKAVIAPAKGVSHLSPHLLKDEQWSAANNIRFGLGYAEKTTGWVKFIDPRPAWAASTAYAAGAFVVPAPENTHVYKCTTAGTSGATQPTWPTAAGGSVTDGTVTWAEVGLNKLDGEIMAIDNYYKFNGDQYLMFVTTKRIYRYDPVNDTVLDITGATPLTGSVDHPITCEIAEDLFVFTNGVDRVKYWDGTAATIADLPGLNDASSGPKSGGVNVTRCKSLLYFQNFLLLLGTSENGVDYPQRLRWSQIGSVRKWKNETNGSGQSGWFDITDGVDWVVAIVSLENYVVVYKDRSIQLLSYSGDDLVWSKQPAFTGVGLLATRALLDLGDQHVFIGPDDIYSFDLTGVKPIGEEVSKEFFRILDPANSGQINTGWIEEIPEGWFVFPSTVSPDGLPDKALVYNPDTKAWSWRDIPMTGFGYYNRKSAPVWGEIEAIFNDYNVEWDSSPAMDNAPINLCGDSQGFLYVLEGHSKDGADLDCFIRTKLFDFGDPYHLKRGKRIQFQISREGPYNLQVRVGTAGNVNEPIVWSGPRFMSLDRTSPPWLDFDVTARYMMFEFATLQKDQPFRLTGYEVYYTTRGTL